MSTEYKHIPRVASFVVKTEGKSKIYTPVNKRAQKLVKKLGKRTRVTATELKEFKNYYKLMQYNAKGKLVSLKV